MTPSETMHRRELHAIAAVKRPAGLLAAIRYDVYSGLPSFVHGGKNSDVFVVWHPHVGGAVAETPHSAHAVLRRKP
jgi:hypothetical protein